MKKGERQELILRIVAEQEIETQDELVSALGEYGCKATQATVSRDIHDLHLIKINAERKNFRYALPDPHETQLDERRIRILSDMVQKVEYAGHTVVVKTISGSAGVVGEVLDTLEWSEILGTIAGDNTVLVIVRHEHDAVAVSDRILLLALPQR